MKLNRVVKLPTTPLSRFIEEFEVGLRDLPRKAEKVAEINSFNDLNPEAFKQYQKVSDDTLERQKKWDSYRIRKYAKWGVLIMGGVVTVLFFIASFSSYMGFIENKELAPFFSHGVIAFISTIIGFGIGAFYEQSKK